jgi:chromosome segregation ATPase
MLRVYLFFFLMATFGGIGYTAYWYYQNTQAELAQLKENNVLLKGATETLENTVQTLQDEADANALEIIELQEALQKSEAGLDRLRKRFTEIDITREALEDPADLERRINRGVERLIENILSDTTPSIDTDSVHENAGDGSSN